MTTFNIFYDSNKNIKWCTDGPVDSATITGQADIGLKHVALDLAQIPACDDWYINDAENGVVQYHDFDDLDFEWTTINIGESLEIQNCPTGTEIFMSHTSKGTPVSQGTYTGGTLTFTGKMAGSYLMKFKKDKYHSFTQPIIVRGLT